MFASLFVVSIASAISINNADTTIITVPTAVAHNAGSFQVIFNISNTGAVGNVNYTYASTSGTSNATFSPSPAQSVAANGLLTVTTTVTFPSSQSDSIAGTITVSDPTGVATSKALTFTVPITSASTYTLSKTAEVTASQNGSLTLANTGNQALTFSLVKSSGSLNLTFSNANPTVPAGTTSTITVSPTVGQSFSIGTNFATVVAVPQTSGVANQSITYTRNGNFCPIGKVTTNLTLRDVELSNSGGEDDEWHPLDEVSVEVELENTGKSDLDDLIVELGLFNANGKNLANKLDFTSDGEEEFEVGDLDDGDDTKVEFTFKVPADLDEGSYTLILKAYSDDISESTLCTDSIAESIQETIKVESEDDEGKFIAFDDIVVSPAQATCGDEVTITADAVNIGEDDEDKVLINLVNRALGINKIVEITQGLDQGDSKMVSFSFTVPQVADGTYNLALSAEYDYKNGVYKQNLDDDVETQLKVFGCSVAPGTTNAVSINAELASEAVTGKDVKVTATLRNNGDKTALFAITATGFESWASLKDISENIVQIPAGQSKDVTITLTPQDDAAGEQSFTINARTDDGKVQSRQVVVQVENGSLFGGSSWVWTLVAINVVLVILIIVVAVIVSRR